ncbi:MAG: protein kinase [Myxococcota bacterium]
MARKLELPIGFEDLRGKEFKERYSITEFIGMTSRRVMFGGTDQQTERPVVVRLSRPLAVHDAATRGRFEKRMTAWGRIEHSTIEAPLDSGELFDGKLYIVCARPPGEPLDRFLEGQAQGRLAWEDARPLVLGLVQALGVAHSRRLVHGALSPMCCWVDRGEAGLSLRLLDLGMNANPEGEDGDIASSRTRTVGDDAVFMAPEAVGGMLGDERTDLYLVGLLVYLMLTGRPPFAGANAFQLATAHMQTPVPAMEKFGAEVPSDVEAMVRKLLAKSVDERPAGMSDVERAIVGDAASAMELAGSQQPRGRRGRGRGKRGRVGSREEVVQRLGGGHSGAVAMGRRLPGQEILDPRASVGSRGDVPRGGGRSGGRASGASSGVGLGVGTRAPSGGSPWSSAPQTPLTAADPALVSSGELTAEPAFVASAAPVVRSESSLGPIESPGPRSSVASPPPTPPPTQPSTPPSVAGVMGPQGTVALSRSEFIAAGRAVPSVMPPVSSGQPGAMSRGPSEGHAVPNAMAPVSSGQPSAMSRGPSEGHAVPNAMAPVSSGQPSAMRRGPSEGYRVPNAMAPVSSGQQSLPHGRPYASGAQSSPEAGGPPRRSRIALWIVVALVASVLGLGVGTVLKAV